MACSSPSPPSVELQQSAPDGVSKARTTPQWPRSKLVWPFPPAVARVPEEVFTLVQSKKERRRQRKETDAMKDEHKKTHSQSVELVWCAPDGGARTRAPPQDSVTASSAEGNCAARKPVELPVRAPGGFVERTRKDDDAEDEDQEQRKDKTSMNEDQDPDMDPVGSYAEWQLTATGESLTTRYQAVRWLELERQLNFSVRVSSSGEFFVRAKSWKTACALSEIACDRTEGIVLVKCETVVRGVVLGFPVHLPLDPIVDHPSVREAERCLYNAGRGRRLPTRSVRVTVVGTLPLSLDLGCWGRYACRRYVPEPLRCFRCQAYGHHQRSCPRSDDLCGACSGNHPTRECLLRRREGEDTAEPLCINCGDRHFAWYRRCPARLRRIPGAVLPPRVSQRRYAAPGESSHPTAAPADRSRQRPAAPPAATVTVQGAATLTEGDSRRGRRRRRRRRKLPRPRENETSTRYSRGTLEEGTKAIVTVAPETKTAKTQTENLCCSRRTQTGRCYVYSEAGLADLLIQYEHLLAQEREAQRSRTAHEPALHCVRRHVRGGQRVPHKLPTAVPLVPSVRFRHHCDETEWVAYGPEEAETQEEEELESTEGDTDPAVDDDPRPDFRWESTASEKKKKDNYVRVLPAGIKPVRCSPAADSRGPGNGPSCKQDRV